MAFGLEGKTQGFTQDAFVSALRGALRLSEVFVLTLVLQFGMLPLMARDFHRIPLLGLIANLFVVPLTGIIVPFGFLSLAASLALPSLGKLFAPPLSWLVALQSQIVTWLAYIPGSSYRIPLPPVWLLLLFFTATLVVMASYRLLSPLRRWPILAGTGIALFSAGLIATFPFRPSFTPNSLEVTVLDVGQGDSILVVSPRGSTLLIDGGGTFEGFRGQQEHFGPDPGEDAVSPYLWSCGFKRLNAIAVTHAHQDHIGGMTAILDNFGPWSASIAN